MDEFENSGANKIVTTLRIGGNIKDLVFVFFEALADEVKVG